MWCVTILIIWFLKKIFLAPGIKIQRGLAVRGVAGSLVAVLVVGEGLLEGGEEAVLQEEGVVAGRHPESRHTPRGDPGRFVGSSGETMCVWGNQGQAVAPPPFPTICGPRDPPWDGVDPNTGGNVPEVSKLWTNFFHQRCKITAWNPTGKKRDKNWGHREANRILLERFRGDVVPSHIGIRPHLATLGERGPAPRTSQ